MLENPPKEASFDHVNADGDLIFICENTPLVVHFDDTLERAIAEAQRRTRKQSDDKDANDVAQTNTATLPISQIQALIRAGVDPTHVAQRYHVSEAQVRRFSAGVETEKQYAIEQFLLVPAPKQSNMRTLSELIERTLAKAHIGMETVKWHATRRGLEPWRISAEFKTATRTIKAEWTWNMHDNTVTCANPSSRLLLGEESVRSDSSKQVQFGGAYRDTVSIDFPFSHDELPGNSIRSARIERAVSQWELKNADNNAVPVDTIASSKTADGSLSNNAASTNRQNLKSNATKEKSVLNTVSSKENTKNSKLDHVNAFTQDALNVTSDNENAASNNKVNNSKSEADKTSDKNLDKELDKSSDKKNNSKETTVIGISALSRKSPAKSASKNIDNNKAKNQNDLNSITNVSAENLPDDAHAQRDRTEVVDVQANTVDKTINERHKKRTGRSAVPSWDEILFGEG